MFCPPSCQMKIKLIPSAALGLLLVCVACITPEVPSDWKREFPVLGAVSGSVGCLAAMEAIKVIAGLGEPLAGRLLTYDLRRMTFHTIELQRRPDCPVCGDG